MGKEGRMTKSQGWRNGRQMVEEFSQGDRKGTKTCNQENLKIPAILSIMQINNREGL